MDQQTFEVIVKRLQEFTRLWEEFIRLFDKGLELEIVSSEDEQRFKNLQYELIRRCQYLSLVLPKDIFGIEGDVKKLFFECPSLRILKTEPNIRINAFRSIWHESQISLNKMSGQIRTLIQESASKKKSFFKK